MNAIDIVLKKVKKLDEKELLMANQAIIGRLKKLRKLKNFRALEHLEMGDNVYFIHTKDGRRIEGKIVKIGHKYVKVLDAKENMRWRVPAFMLKKMEKTK